LGWEVTNFECGALSDELLIVGRAEFDALLGERRKRA
jgi:hypothetical protein